MFIYLVVAYVLGALVTYFFGPRLHAAESSFVGDMRQLVADGVLEEKHLVEYVEAHIAQVRADAAHTALQVAKNAEGMPEAMVNDAIGKFGSAATAVTKP